MMAFAEENVLVTGASRGIGRAVALELARRGANVVVHYHANRSAADAVVAEIRRAGRRAIAVQADLGAPRLPEGFVRAVETELGPIRRIVANAGIASLEMGAFLPIDEWNSVLETNLRGALVVCQAFLPKMIKAGSGSVVFVSSEAAAIGCRGMAAYAASKAGLVALAKTLALELAARGIRVNVVSPGLIETEMLADITERARDAITLATPLGRLGRPEDVARAIAFLLSDEEAAFVTGEVLSVGGGLQAFPTA